MSSEACDVCPSSRSCAGAPGRRCSSRPTGWRRRTPGPKPQVLLRTFGFLILRSVLSLRHALTVACRGLSPTGGRVTGPAVCRPQLRPFARHGRVTCLGCRARRSLRRQGDPHRLTGVAEETGRLPRGERSSRSSAPEATGKSTMLEDTARWLGAHYTVRRVHTGKPPGTPSDLPLPTCSCPRCDGSHPGQRSTGSSFARPETSRRDAATIPPGRSRCCSGSVRSSSPTTGRALLTRAFAEGRERHDRPLGPLPVMGARSRRTAPSFATPRTGSNLEGYTALAGRSRDSPLPGDTRPPISSSI